MSDEINSTPAVREDDKTAIDGIPDAVKIVDPEQFIELKTSVHVAQNATPWHELSDSQKLDVLNMKLDSIAERVDWIGQTFQGVINMVGNVSPMDIFKMMRGGK